MGNKDLKEMIPIIFPKYRIRHKADQSLLKYRDSFIAAGSQKFDIYT